MGLFFLLSHTQIAIIRTHSIPPELSIICIILSVILSDLNAQGGGAIFFKCLSHCFLPKKRCPISEVARWYEVGDALQLEQSCNVNPSLFRPKLILVCRH